MRLSPLVPLLALLPLMQTAQAKFMTPWEARSRGSGSDSLLEECQYRWEGGEWVLERKTGYEYDGSGNLIHASLYSRQGSAPPVNKAWEFAYNSERVWTRVAERTPGDTGTSLALAPIIGAVQAYTGPGGERIQVTNEWNRNGLFAAAQSVTLFDSRGEEKSRLSSKYAGGIWIPTASTQITRNAARQILREDVSNLESGENFSTVYEYNAQGQPTSIAAAGRYRETWDYTPDGKLAAFRYSTWTTGTWTRMVSERYGYDANGNRTLVLREDESGNRKRFESSFDAPARTLLTLESQYQDSAWIPSLNTEYLRNALGDTLLKTESVWHDGKWNLQQQTALGYDAGRRPNDWKVYSREGARWVLYSRAHVDAVHDREGRILSARSDSWSSGNEASTGESAYEYDARGRTLLAVYKDISASGAVTGSKTTHRYLPASPQTALGPRPKRAGVARPRLVSGKIRMRGGDWYNAGGRALRQAVLP
ncbi:MAG TPA: hypothetical protein VJ385_01545 [Fibrobacteria bacterium]|nr:hypothetical protein [Fibrobacteria bacterium]